MNSIASLRWSDALLIGVFQVLALIPGTSRSGATILGGILIGTSREVAAEYIMRKGITLEEFKDAYDESKNDPWAKKDDK